MLNFRVTHEYDDIYGWSFRCDEHRISGGLEHLPHHRYEDCVREAESALWFLLEYVYERRSVPLPRPEDVRIVHVMETPTAASAPAA
jgi:hypothetical protein